MEAVTFAVRSFAVMLAEQDAVEPQKLRDTEHWSAPSHLAEALRLRENKTETKSAIERMRFTI